MRYSFGKRYWEHDRNGLRDLSRLLDPIPRQLQIEAATRQSQFIRDPRDIPIIASQRRTDHLHFEFRDGLIERAAVTDVGERRDRSVKRGNGNYTIAVRVARDRPCRALEVGREVFGRYNFTVYSACDYPLNLVAELTNIAVPLANH